MTDETKKPKKKPAYYVYANGQTNKPPVGAIFRHGKGEGLNILIGEGRYVAFPPKAKPEREEEGV